MDEGYPEKSASPTSVLENGILLAASEASVHLKRGLSFNGFREKDGRGEEEDYERTVAEKLDLKQGIPYESYENKQVREEEERYDGKADLNDDKGEGNEKGSGQHEEDYSYLADLESRAAVKFNKMVFFKEFIYHTFWPLSGPLMYYLDGGWFALSNRSFLGGDSPALVLTQLFWAANFYLLNVVSLVYISEAKHYDFLYDIVLVDLLWGLRNLVVATKYAFLSKIEMEEMRTKRVPPYVHQYRTVLAAWKDPIPRRVLKYELLLSALRNKLILKKYSFKLDSNVDSTQAIRDLVIDLRLSKIDFNSLSFSYGKRADRWLEIDCEELAKDPLAWAEAGGQVNLQYLPSRLYAAHVIRQASSLRRLKRLGHTLLSQHLRACCFVLGFSHAVIPAAGRFILGGHPIPGPPWATYCVLIPSLVLISFAMVSNVGFMMVGVLDFRRRHFIAQSLDEVLRTGAYTGATHVRTASMKSEKSSKWVSIIPGMFGKRLQSESEEFSSRNGSSGALSGDGIFFDFSTAESLLAWWTCRQLMVNFGYGFLKRIKYYTTCFAGYCVILLIYLVMKMLTGIKKADCYLLITVVFSIDVFLTLLALMVWPGGDANHMLQLHGTTLIRRKIRTQMKLIKEGKHLNPEEDLNMPRATIDTINSIADGVKWDNTKVKLSICGFEARDQLVSVIVAVLTASMSIGVGQLVQNGLIP
ncbi:unnamed protein product [Calypogeia fissa]